MIVVAKTKALAALVLVAALVAAPVEVRWVSADAVNLKELPITGMAPGSCPKGEVVKLELADGRLIALGDNDRAVQAEPSNDADGYPVVTLGSWNPQTGELTMHPATKHKAREGDSLCRDLFPEGA